MFFLDDCNPEVIGLSAALAPSTYFSGKGVRQTHGDAQSVKLFAEMRQIAFR